MSDTNNADYQRGYAQALRDIAEEAAWQEMQRQNERYHERSKFDVLLKVCDDARVVFANEMGEASGELDTAAQSFGDDHATAFYDFLKKRNYTREYASKLYSFCWALNGAQQRRWDIAYQYLGQVMERNPLRAGLTIANIDGNGGMLNPRLVTATEAANQRIDIIEHWRSSGLNKTSFASLYSSDGSEPRYKLNYDSLRKILKGVKLES